MIIQVYCVANSEIVKLSTEIKIQGTNSMFKRIKLSGEPFLNSLHSVLFYHIAPSIKTCHMSMAELSTYNRFAFLKKNRYIDGSVINIWQFSNLLYVDVWAINIWLVRIFIFWNLNTLKQKHVSRQQKYVICWGLNHQHMTCFCFKVFKFKKMKI